MKKTVSPQQPSFFSRKPKNNVLLIALLMLVSLMIFVLLFFDSQAWITLAFSTLS